MSCCGGNCGCGSSCKCGNGCRGCKMFPDLTEKAAVVATKAAVLGFAPVNKSFDGFEMEEDGCKCGSNCSCDPCTCK